MFVFTFFLPTLLLAHAGSVHASTQGSSEPSKLIGYWEDWGDLPTASAIENYTHIQYAFMVSYNENCEISPIDGSAVQFFQQAGKKVLASVGGWNQNPWWQYCDANSLASQLVSLVGKYGLDGIDLDYELNPPDSNFVVTLNNQLRAQLPEGALLTHAPMNSLMDVNASYWNILAKCDGVDFISVQYYNNPPNPVTNPQGSISHYADIVNQLYGGDATKVAFGLCISDCGSAYDMDSQSAAALTQSLVSTFPGSFGGIMNWAQNQGDMDGSWSAPLVGVMQNQQKKEQK